MMETIRKFGLGYSDFPTMLWNISLFLRLLSLNVDPRNKKRIPVIVIILNLMFAVSYLYVYVGSMLWFVFYKCMKTGDVLPALIVFSLGTSSQIGPFKLIFMQVYKKKVNEMVAKCLARDALVNLGSRFSINLTASLRIVKKRAMLYWSMILGNGIMYMLKPIFMPGRHLMDDIFVPYGLEPISADPNYQIAFVVTAMAVLVAAYTPSNATAFQFIITGYIEAQMQAWSEELRNLWEDAEKHYATYRLNTNDMISDERDERKERDLIINDFVNRRLKDIIIAHAINIDISRELEEVFRGAIAVEFVLLLVCLIAELLGGLQNTYMQVPYALIQVGMDCFIGQKLTDASIVFQRAVYDCKWEQFNAKNMKIVFTMLMTSQKNMTLTAGYTVELNFISFLSILKMIYSTYTTLSATMH